MKSFNYTITDPVGLHARPAGLLVKEVKNYASLVTISKAGKSCDAKKLMMLILQSANRVNLLRNFVVFVKNSWEDQHQFLTWKDFLILLVMYSFM